MQPETEDWLGMAEEDWTAALLLHEAGLRNSAAFHVHLAVEKVLKAVIAEFRDVSAIPYTHDLVHLARFADLPVPAETLAFLRALSPHGVSARYLRNSEYDSARVSYFIEKADETVTWLRQRLS